MPDKQRVNQKALVSPSAKREAVDQFFYEVYELCIKHSDVPASKKKKVLEWAADLGVESWPITGITVAALELFLRQRSFAGIHRGHKGEYGRRDRVQRALSKKMSKVELLRDFRESDKTVLITLQEQHCEWSDIIRITDPMLFRGDGRVRPTRKNFAWADEEARKRGLNLV